MVNKEECKALYRELKRDFGDLDSVNFKELWFVRARALKERGCFWHYAVLIRKSRDYLKGKGDYSELWR